MSVHFIVVKGEAVVCCLNVLCRFELHGYTPAYVNRHSHFMHHWGWDPGTHALSASTLPAKSHPQPNFHAKEMCSTHIETYTGGNT